MGGGNPFRGITTVVRGMGRAVKDNPEKAFLGPIGLSPIGLINEGIEEETDRATKKAQNAAQAAAKKEAQQAALLAEEKEEKKIADESVKNQKKLARRRTVFAGSNIEQGVFKRTLGG